MVALGQELAPCSKISKGLRTPDLAMVRPSQGPHGAVPQDASMPRSLRRGTRERQVGVVAPLPIEVEYPQRQSCDADIKASLPIA